MNFHNLQQPLIKQWDTTRIDCKFNRHRKIGPQCSILRHASSGVRRRRRNPTLSGNYTAAQRCSGGAALLRTIMCFVVWGLITLRGSSRREKKEYRQPGYLVKDPQLSALISQWVWLFQYHRKTYVYHKTVSSTKNYFLMELLQCGIFLWVIICHPEILLTFNPCNSVFMSLQLRKDEHPSPPTP